jgi:hypothetical protein
MSAATDSRYALLALIAEDMYADPQVLEPQADPRLASNGWALRGYLTGCDALLRARTALSLGEQRVFYGFLAESTLNPGVFACVVRGTDGLIEWLEDAEFALMAHPVSGRVEAGFWGIYATMHYRAPGGEDVPLLQGLVCAIGAGDVTVIGHSLGAALATYLTYDLAAPKLLGHQVAGRFFASPRPGDDVFAKIVADQVSDQAAYAYEFDVVPRVPFGFGFAPLASVKEFAASAIGVRIKVNPFCSHHALSYCAILDPSSLDLAGIPDQDRPYAACIRGH